MRNILNVLKKEKTEMLRDKKSLAMMLVIPFFIPFIIIGISFIFDGELNKDVKDYNKIGFNYSLSEVEKSMLKEYKIDYVEKSTKDLEKLYKKEKIDLYVTRKNNIYTINYKTGEKAAFAKELVNEYLESYKMFLQDEYLNQKGIASDEVINIISIKENVITEDNFYKEFLVSYAFIFVMMAITVSATYPATDSTAGEKERGTLETLLTFPIKSRDIIVGKFLSVSISSIVTGVLSLVFALVSLKISGNLVSIFKDIDLTLSFSSILVSIITIILYSFLISGLCIAVASKCKSFKEAQSSLTPLTFISFFPGMIAFMLDIKSSNLLSVIPFINYSLLLTEASKGVINYSHIFLMIISTIIIIFVVLEIIIRQYKSEKVLFSK